MLDSSSNKVLKFFDVQNGRPLNIQIEHANEIKEFGLNNTEQGAQRKVAFLDANKDLFISPTIKKDPVD